ncbi:hypothetical protein Efla_005001 [Eimeria flavescens]
MDMQMTFYWGYDATILFSSKLKALCHDIQREQPKDARVLALTACAAPSAATATGTTPGLSSSQSPQAAEVDTWRATPPLLQAPLSHSPYNMEQGTWAQAADARQFDAPEGSSSAWKGKSFVIWLLLLLSVGIDWAMMLVCMTFNGGLFLAVVIGVATGQVLLQHKSERGSECCASSSHG